MTLQIFVRIVKTLAHLPFRACMRVLAWLLATAFAGGLHDTARAAGWSGFIAASSDNVYRGLTQSDGDPSLAADLHWRSDAGWFAGIGLATVNRNPGPGAPLEIAAYAGRSAPLSPALNARLSVVHYEYPREQDSLHYGYDELLAALTWRDRAALNLSYSPNTSRFSYDAVAVHRPAWSVEGVWRQPLTRSWSVAGGLGRYAMSAPIDAAYWYWNVSLLARRDSWELELSAIGTDDHASELFGPSVAGQRWVLSLIRRIPGSR